MKDNPTGGLTATIIAEEEIARVGDKTCDGDTITLEDIKEMAEFDSGLVVDEEKGILKLVLKEEKE